MDKRRPLGPDQATRWAAAAQFHFLEALMAEPALRYEEIAFHGGTSLHFSWRSPRRSEDLDFLLARSSADIQQIVQRAAAKVAEAFRAEHPGFTVEIQDRTRHEGRMISYELRVSRTDVIGKALIKVEFWRVRPEYLANYPVELRSPQPPGELVSRVSNPVPAATLETAYCDKLTAFATRPYLKWRDIYDLWWIGTQTDAQLDTASVVRQFLHNVSAYQTLDGLPPAQALRKFLEHDSADLLRKADPDLKRWLPGAVWEKMHPRVTNEMVRYTKYALQTVADAIDGRADGASLKSVPR